MYYYKKRFISISYKYLFLLFIFLFVQKEIYSQIKIIDTIYKTFDNRTVKVFLIEGVNVVLNIDKNEINNNQLKDSTTLLKILNRVDTLYSYYKFNLGYEPTGGNVNYFNKADVFFGIPSCGSGCGKIGQKGIECSGFNNIFFNLKYGINVNRDVIIGWEFGRNFTPFIKKFSYNERGTANIGFSQGISSLLFYRMYDEILNNNNQRVFNETLLNQIWAKENLIGYINDSTANQDNSFGINQTFVPSDLNRMPPYGIRTYDNLVLGILNQLKVDSLKFFFNECSKLNDANNLDDVINNFILATSKSTNKNLIPYFKNVLKFKIKDSVNLIVKEFNKVKDGLIRYEDTLWFTTPLDKIRLNLRSFNYLEDNLTYKLYINNELFSTSKNGNNLLDYSLLKNKNETTLIAKLMDSKDNVIDSFSVKIMKRHNINLSLMPKNWYAYYLSNINTISLIDSQSYVLKNLNDTATDQGYLYFNLPVIANRKISLTGEIKNISKYQYKNEYVDNFSGFGLFSPSRLSGTSRVGYDIAKNDTINFYKVNLKDSTQLFMGNEKFYTIRIGLYNGGIGMKSHFKNLIFRDETDLDADGVVDFEDSCNFGENSVKPIFNTSNFNFCNGDTLKLTINNLKQNEKLIWYYGGQVDSTNKLSLNVTDSMKLFVLKKDSIGCSRYSDTIQIKKFQIPTTPTLSRDTASFLVSNTNIGNTWYKDGIELKDTAQKIKPISPGSYRVKSTQNGCVSSLSTPYYYLVTDIINLSNDEFIKLAPNPFINQLNFDFFVKGYQMLNIEVFDVATGTKVASQPNLTAGCRITLGHLSAGTFVIRVTSTDNKISYQFKMVKL